MSKRIAVLLTLGIFLAALADVSAQERGGRGGHRRPKEDNAPKVGQKAPEFTIKSLDGKKSFELARAKGKKPVLLFFGSYT